MKKISITQIVGGFTLLAFAVSGCATKPSTSSSEVVPATQKVAAVSFIYQSNRGSALEPCGCEYKPWGGIDREANAVEKLRQSTPNLWYIDSGNLYTRLKSKVSHQYVMEKGALMTDMLNRMKLDVFSPGPWDYTIGIASLKELSAKAKFKFISSNVLTKDGSSLFLPYHMEKRGDVTFGFISLTPVDAVKEAGITVEAPEKTLARLLPELTSKVDFIVLLSQLDNEATQAIGEKYPDIRLIVGANDKIVTEKPYWFVGGKTLLVDPESYGMFLGKLDIEYRTPFQGFYSPQAISDNREELKILEQSLVKSPNDKMLPGMIDNVKKTKILSAIKGGSPYGGELIKLDKVRYGQKNDITQLIAKQKANVRTKAISH
jgi:2',3'-cyclic-nucleotide 2'-phosphodiesterase (5'-nucleotidase family)